MKKERVCVVKGKGLSQKAELCVVSQRNVERREPLTLYDSASGDFRTLRRAILTQTSTKPDSKPNLPKFCIAARVCFLETDKFVTEKAPRSGHWSVPFFVRLWLYPLPPVVNSTIETISANLRPLGVFISFGICVVDKNSRIKLLQVILDQPHC